MGTATLDIRVQNRAVIKAIREMLPAVGALLSDLVQVTAPRDGLPSTIAS